MKISLYFPALALAIALNFATPALAQEVSYLGVAGSPTIVQTEHPQIQLESERVILTLRNDGKYDSDGTFVFVNQSAQKVAVEMEIPENNSGEGAENHNGLDKPTAFDTFSMSVDGAKVNAKRGGVQVTDLYQEMRWKQTVNFAPRARRTVRVQAVSPIGGDTNAAFNRTLSYVFAGANWKGNIARSDLEVRVPLKGNWAASGVEYPPYKGGGIEVWTPKPDKNGKVGVLRRSWRNWNASTLVQIGLRRVIPGWLIEPKGNTSLFTSRELDNASSFRVGAPDAKFVGDIPAFVRKGVAMVSMLYLEQRASKLLPDHGGFYSWETGKNRVSMKRGAHTIALREGSKTMMVDGTKKVALRTAPAMFRGDGVEIPFVPLAESARALGLKVSVDAANHQFYLRR